MAKLEKAAREARISAAILKAGDGVAHTISRINAHAHNKRGEAVVNGMSSEII